MFKFGTRPSGKPRITQNRAIQIVLLGALLCVFHVSTILIKISTSQASSTSSQSNVTSPQTNTEDHRGEAKALNAAGESAYAQGELRVSIDYFNRALTLWTTADDKKGQALANLNLGYSYADLGDLMNAQQCFMRASSLYREIRDQRGEASAVTAMGSVHSFMGEKQKALDNHSQAMNIFRSLGDRQGEAVALNSIAKDYEDLNELETALDNYRRALQINQELGNEVYEAVTTYYLGRVNNSLGNKKQALAYYEQTLLLSRRIGLKRITAYALIAISSLRSSEGHAKEAQSLLSQVLQLYRKLGDRRVQANALNAIGHIYYSLKDNKRALFFYRQALHLTKAAADRRGESDTLYNIALAARDSDAPAEALSVLEESLKIIESLRSHIVSPELRASYFASVNNHWELDIDLLMKMHWLQPDRGFAVQAFQASENARARALLEILSEASAQIRQGMDPGLLERERSLQQQLAAKAAYQMRLAGGKADPKETEEAARELRQLTNAYEEVQTQIKQQNPRFASLVQPQPLKVEEIQAELEGPDTVLLQYSLGNERSYLWLVTSESITAYELPGRTKIEGIARNVYQLLTARQSLNEGQLKPFQGSTTESDTQYWNEASVLSNMILGPIASQLGSKRLLIVADGALQYLPFEALPLPNSNDNPGSLNADSVPLVRDHEIVNLPSASILGVIRHTEHAPNTTGKLVAILADPVFETDDPRLSRSKNLSRAVVEQRTESFPRLAATRQEAEAIMDVTPRGQGMLATDFDACRTTAMSGELAGYSIVHFATHGVINTEHPELSGIVLSLINRDGKNENGFLQIHDIYNLNLPNTELVVLSACRTGLGKEIRGEGLVGLTRGFMYAGSRSVVASLWKVDDRATAELMKYFYQGMFQEKLTPSAALQKAKVKMWNQQRWRAPYFWAAFVLQGEYKNEISVSYPIHRNGYILIPALIIMIVATLGAVYLKVRRQRKF